MSNYRHAHILGLMSLAVASFGVTVGSELRTVAIMSGLLAAAAAATFVNEKGWFTRNAPAASAAAPATRGSLLQTKRLLMLMLAIGIVVYAGGAGTFSSFSAETSNTNSSIASGTLGLSDNVNATTCLSTDAPSADNYRASGCGTVLSLSNQAPGVFGGTATLTLANVGSIDGSKLTVYAPYSNTTLSTQINSGTNIATAGLPINTLEGTIASGDTIELDYGGQSLQMVAASSGTASGMYTPGMTSPANTINIATPANQSGTLTNGGATVSSIDATNLRTGMTVTGTGIPANTTISSITPRNPPTTPLDSLTLSQNATSGGTQTLSFSVTATINFKAGTRVYDKSSNVSATPPKTDCWDKITQTADAPIVGAKVGSDLNFNGTDALDGSHWDSTNAYCKTALLWIQEQGSPTPAQTGTLNGTTTVTGLNTALLSPLMSVSGTGIPANTTIASITNGSTIVLSQAATVSTPQSLTFTANYCWTGQGSSGATGSGVPANATGTSITSGSSTVTLSGGNTTAALKPFMTVTAVGQPTYFAQNTMILSITDSTHFVISQPAAVSNGSFTLQYGPANNMCYAPIAANFPTGTQNINNNTPSITFSSALSGNIRSGDTLAISEPKKMVATCIAGQDAYIGATTVTVSGCTSASTNWIAATGETFDGSGASTPASIVDTTVNNLLNSDTTDTISNFDTSHANNNQLELPALQTNGAHVLSGGGTTTVELAKHSSFGDTRVFYIGVYFPAGSGAAQNATQGLAAKFGLSWNLQQ